MDQTKRSLYKKSSVLARERTEKEQESSVYDTLVELRAVLIQNGMYQKNRQLFREICNKTIHANTF